MRLIVLEISAYRHESTCSDNMRFCSPFETQRLIGIGDEAGELPNASGFAMAPGNNRIKELILAPSGCPTENAVRAIEHGDSDDLSSGTTMEPKPAAKLSRCVPFLVRLS